MDFNLDETVHINAPKPAPWKIRKSIVQRSVPKCGVSSTPVPLKHFLNDDVQKEFAKYQGDDSEVATINSGSVTVASEKNEQLRSDDSKPRSVISQIHIDKVINSFRSKSDAKCATLTESGRSKCESNNNVKCDDLFKNSLRSTRNQDINKLKLNKAEKEVNQKYTNDSSSSEDSCEFRGRQSRKSTYFKRKIKLKRKYKPYKRKCKLSPNNSALDQSKGNYRKNDKLPYKSKPIKKQHKDDFNDSSDPPKESHQRITQHTYKAAQQHSNTSSSNDELNNVNVKNIIDSSKAILKSCEPHKQLTKINKSICGSLQSLAPNNEIKDQKYTGKKGVREYVGPSVSKQKQKMDLSGLNKGVQTKGPIFTYDYPIDAPDNKDKRQTLFDESCSDDVDIEISDRMIEQSNILKILEEWNSNDEEILEKEEIRKSSNIVNCPQEIGHDEENKPTIKHSTSQVETNPNPNKVNIISNVTVNGLVNYKNIEKYKENIEDLNQEENEIVNITQFTSQENRSIKNIETISVTQDNHEEQVSSQIIRTHSDQSSGEENDKILTIRIRKSDIVQNVDEQRLQFVDMHSKSFQIVNVNKVNDVLNEEKTEKSVQLSSNDKYPETKFVCTRSKTSCNNLNDKERDKIIKNSTSKKLDSKKSVLQQQEKKLNETDADLKTSRINLDIKENEKVKDKNPRKKMSNKKLVNAEKQREKDLNDSVRLSGVEKFAETNFVDIDSKTSCVNLDLKENEKIEYKNTRKKMGNKKSVKAEKQCEKDLNDSVRLSGVEKFAETEFVDTDSNTYYVNLDIKENEKIEDKNTRKKMGIKKSINAEKQQEKNLSDSVRLSGVHKYLETKSVYTDSKRSCVNLDIKENEEIEDKNINKSIQKKTANKKSVNAENHRDKDLNDSVRLSGVVKYIETELTTITPSINLDGDLDVRENEKIEVLQSIIKSTPKKFSNKKTVDAENQREKDLKDSGDYNLKVLNENGNNIKGGRKKSSTAKKLFTSKNETTKLPNIDTNSSGETGNQDENSNGTPRRSTRIKKKEIDKNLSNKSSIARSKKKYKSTGDKPKTQIGDENSDLQSTLHTVSKKKNITPRVSLLPPEVEMSSIQLDRFPVPKENNKLDPHVFIERNNEISKIIQSQETNQEFNFIKPTVSPKKKSRFQKTDTFENSDAFTNTENNSTLRRSGRKRTQRKFPVLYCSVDSCHINDYADIACNVVIAKDIKEAENAIRGNRQTNTMAKKKTTKKQVLPVVSEETINDLLEENSNCKQNEKRKFSSDEVPKDDIIENVDFNNIEALECFKRGQEYIALQERGVYETSHISYDCSNAGRIKISGRKKSKKTLDNCYMHLVVLTGRCKIQINNIPHRILEKDDYALIPTGSTYSIINDAPNETLELYYCQYRTKEGNLLT